MDWSIKRKLEKTDIPDCDRKVFEIHGARDPSIGLLRTAWNFEKVRLRFASF